ncbi:GNAT family N-acetyltransferase [Erythrobacteraceae bacterium E2-1 Yellow Sea]|nr:GNAT family N-acetyltransferase [Erythrobacteraceae bacterium E2-1 Yellow Sea]
MKVEVLTGRDILPVISALARLRIAVFAEWPYLYAGDLDYEEHYLRDFAVAHNAVLVLARDGDDIVSASTASPMIAQAEEIRTPVATYGFDTKSIFYFGESVLLPQYRGRRLGHTFFDGRENHARQCGAKSAMFAGVIRPTDHLARPADYRPLDAFWQARGYQRVCGLTCKIAWQDHDEAGATPKSLQFWMRTL